MYAPHQKLIETLQAISFRPLPLEPSADNFADFKSNLLRIEEAISDFGREAGQDIRRHTNIGDITDSDLKHIGADIFEVLTYALGEAEYAVQEDEYQPAEQPYLQSEFV